MKAAYFVLASFVWIIGTFFSACSDPCENIQCLNGGICNNGECDCPPDYTGTNCQIKPKPKSMKITKIVVNSYPITQQNGYGWDALYPGSFGAAPDMYVVIQRNSGDIGVSYKVKNASYTQPINLTFSNIPEFYPLTGRCDVNLYDSDVDDDNTYPDAIGEGYYFFPETYMDAAESVIPLFNDMTWHKIKIDMYVTWVY